ncbi:MAG: Hpt domain-containing protein, partial [Methanothrix sp.]|nr:Hpt domain-containing protein [Methanothrix sp.]
MEYSELIKDFLDDADAHLKEFDSALLSLEKNGQNNDVILNTLGSLHTLKGNSGMMGFESLKLYIHQIEEVLQRINENDSEFGQSLEALFSSANVIRNSIQGIARKPSFNPDLTEHIMSLQQKLEGEYASSESEAVDLVSYLGTKTDTIKVDFERLDDLLNLVGELVIFKTRLNQIESDSREAINNKALSKEFNDGLEL